MKANATLKLFVTVGTQFPFDRLVRTVDEWVARTPGVEAFAQVGPGNYKPRHMDFQAFVGADECRRRVQEATAVVAHAGMGSIISALELAKPIIVMPRVAAKGEHRNDHQLATAKSLLALGKVTVAFDEAHLAEKLANLEQLSTGRKISRHASPRLLEALRGFIQTGDRATGRGAVVAAGLAEEMADFVGHRPQGARRAEEAAVLVNG